MDKNLTERENLYYILLSTYNTVKKGVRLKAVAKIMAALESELINHSSEFTKHSEDDVTDRKDELKLVKWYSLTVVADD